MDITYLLFLQNYRHNTHDAWTPFMQGFSFFSVAYLILIAVFIYWCVDKRNGLYTLCATCLSLVLNGLIKLSVCAYRPWIRDARIIPAGNAIYSASGYSFPSGHVMGATPLYGGLAVGFWKNETTRCLSILCVMGVLITGFSRNYLGVHTPQDVIVGIFLSIGTLLATAWIFNYVTKYPQQENKFLLGGLILCLLTLVYITYKPYPLLYVDGKLLVDPVKMMADEYGETGYLVAFCIARYIEKRWIRFQVTGLTLKGIILAAIGLAILWWGIIPLQSPLESAIGQRWGRFIAQGFFMFYIIALYPLVLKWFAPSKRH